MRCWKSTRTKKIWKNISLKLLSKLWRRGLLLIPTAVLFLEWSGLLLAITTFLPTSGAKLSTPALIQPRKGVGAIPPGRLLRLSINFSVMERGTPTTSIFDIYLSIFQIWWQFCYNYLSNKAKDHWPWHWMPPPCPSPSSSSSTFFLVLGLSNSSEKFSRGTAFCFLSSPSFVSEYRKAYLRIFSWSLLMELALGKDTIN